jgi:hypothetical protein
MTRLSPRARLIRDAILYTPPFALFATMLALMIAGIWDRAIVGMIIIALLTFLFGYQSIQTFRDLFSQPRDLVGPIRRLWTKRDGFVVKNYYMSVEKAIFHIPADEYLQLREGDLVRVHAYPHTGTVIAIEKIAREAPEHAEPVPRDLPRAASGRMRTLRTARATPRRRAPSSAETSSDRNDSIS